MKPTSCAKTGKVRYETPQDAAAAAKLIGKRHSTEMRTYRCDFCRGHHITGHTRNKRLLFRQRKGAE